MTTKYRVEYALKTHRRDQFIEWIKGLLAVPFVLHAQPTLLYDQDQDADASVRDLAATVRRRYAEIMRDVEGLVGEHIAHQKAGTPERSKLKFLVPSLGTFFTPLHLEAAFLHVDRRRHISSRHFVPPSFNDVRSILNTAQLLSLVKDASQPVELITFDGDVTLYDDGACLTPENPVIPYILRLLQKGIYVGIVTAAGYTDPALYYNRLYGLLDAVFKSHDLSPGQESSLVVLGGECNFFYRLDPSENKDESKPLLKSVPREEWALEEMKRWTEQDIQELLDVASKSLHECVKNMELQAMVVRKERAVGIAPKEKCRLEREQLEETVLVVQRALQISEVGKRIPFCAFNGGSDVFVDIGDKSWGVQCIQRFFGGIEGARSLHVGDQFLSANANDFKARLACTTAWIANPHETVQLLDELEYLHSSPLSRRHPS